MIVFHEGLPGSGKSYECTVFHIIPALAKGRKVFARINGLNYAKLGELAGITEERCRELLVHIEESQVSEIYKHVDNDSLVVIDELQNFWPAGRAKLEPGITQFVTEHRHRGIDIICMGQSQRDCHNIWRRRTERKITFLKMSALGMDKRYQWTAYAGVLDAKGEITWKRGKSGTRKYEEKYFGCYASHQSDTENTDTYSDDRFNIFKTGLFKFWLPLAVVGALYGCYWLWGFFHGGSLNPQQPKTEQATQGTPTQSRPSQPAPRPKAKPVDWLAQTLTADGREVALTYLQRMGNRPLDFLIEVRDKAGTTLDAVTMRDCLEAGYSIRLYSYGLQIKKEDFVLLARERPVPMLVAQDSMPALQTPSF